MIDFSLLNRTNPNHTTTKPSAFKIPMQCNAEKDNVEAAK